MATYDYSYAAAALKMFPDLARRIKCGRVVPDQVEIHLPPRGAKPCWLRCPHCYTDTSKPRSDRRISLGRLLSTIEDISAGHPLTGEIPKRLVFGGLNTDPLNSPYIEQVVARSRDCGFTLGIHTKGLKISDSLVGTLTCGSREGDYITFSLDAGSDDVYNAAHGVKNGPKLFTQVVGNAARLLERRMRTHSAIDVTATYLVTRFNCTLEEVQHFAATMLSLGVDRIRVSPPMRPVMGFMDRPAERFPQAEHHHIAQIRRYVLALKERYPHRVYYLDLEPRPVRTLPCHVRWLQPTIGYDGFLYPCCLTASSDFSSLRIADLQCQGFWQGYLKNPSFDFAGANCQCDRKSAEINAAVQAVVSQCQSTCVDCVCA